MADESQEVKFMADESQEGFPKDLHKCLGVQLYVNEGEENEKPVLHFIRFNTRYPGANLETFFEYLDTDYPDRGVSQYWKVSLRKFDNKYSYLRAKRPPMWVKYHPESEKERLELIVRRDLQSLWVDRVKYNQQTREKQIEYLKSNGYPKIRFNDLLMWKELDEKAKKFRKISFDVRKDGSIKTVHRRSLISTRKLSMKEQDEMKEIRKLSLLSKNLDSSKNKDIFKIPNSQPRERRNALLGEESNPEEGSNNAFE